MGNEFCSDDETTKNPHDLTDDDLLYNQTEPQLAEPLIYGNQMKKPIRFGKVQNDLAPDAIIQKFVFELFDKILDISPCFSFCRTALQQMLDLLYEMPITPKAISICLANEEYRIENVLKSHGHFAFKQLCPCLQGSIWEISTASGERNIIKVVDKSLHKRGTTYIDGREVVIAENIVMEANILRYLTNYDNHPRSLTKFIGFHEDENNLFLTMEHSGQNFFSFVQKCHKYIECGSLDLMEWSKFCHNAMRQMVDVLEWMHNTKSVCHLDVSLENFAINNINVTRYFDRNRKRIIKLNDNFQMKIIDFGLAEVFVAKNKHGATDFRCTKYVGKTAYQSPEVYAQQIFDGRSTDCWSLGVAFFMMIVGCSPFQTPSRDDAAFCMIMNGQMIDVLNAWNRLHYVTPNMVDLWRRIFVKQRYRINIEGIQKHPSLL